MERKVRFVSLALLVLALCIGSVKGQGWKEYTDATGLTWEFQEIEAGRTCRIELASKKGVEGHVAIPCAVSFGSQKDIKVVELAQEAFLACKGITSLAIPAGIKTIGAGAFSQCKGLRSIDIPEGVEVIGDDAFLDCDALARVELPESLRFIGDFAFKGCGELSAVRFPAKLARIGENAFLGCGKLTHFEIDNAASDHFIALEGVLFSKDAKTLFLCPEGKSGEYIIPNDVIAIGDGAFQSCSLLTAVEIPSGVTSLGVSAFQSCSGLTALEIPEGVSSIPDYAFSGCSNLANLTLPSRLAGIGEFAFAACEALTEMTIPRGVEILKKGTFAGCSNLVSLAVPSSVTTFRIDALTGCSRLMTLNVDEGNNAFIVQDGVLYSMDRKTLVYCPASRQGSFDIPSGVQTIGIGAFYDCEGLTAINIPQSVTAIAEFAFYNCSGLTEVIIPSDVKRIRHNTFSFCTSLRSVIIPKRVTKIGEAAFSLCKSLTNVTIPARVRSVGKRAFYQCYTLSDVNWLAMSRCKVEKDAFEEIPALATLYVRRGAKSAIMRSPSGWWGNFGRIVEGSIVDFDAVGGAYEPAALIVEEGQCVAKPAKDPAKDGHVFSGWYLGADAVAPYDFGNVVEDDITLTARWQAVAAPAYTVTFAAGQGAFEGGEKVVEVQVLRGRTVDEPSVNQLPTRAGYEFVEWQKDGVRYSFDAPVMGSITLAAQWAQRAESNPPTAVEPASLAALRAVGNPLGRRLVLEGVTAAEKLEVYDLLGVLVYEQSLQGEPRVEVEADGWQSGAYVVRVLAKDGERTLRVVKK